MPARVVEDLVAFLYVGQAVVQQCEHCRGDLLAQAIARAKILVDPDLHLARVSLLVVESTFAFDPTVPVGRRKCQ